jgi:hypothetical protein
MARGSPSQSLQYLDCALPVAPAAPAPSKDAAGDGTGSSAGEALGLNGAAGGEGGGEGGPRAAAPAPASVTLLARRSDTGLRFELPAGQGLPVPRPPWKVRARVGTPRGIPTGVGLTLYKRSYLTKGHNLIRAAV